MIRTLLDWRTWINQSDIGEWSWGPNTSAHEFALWLWRADIADPTHPAKRVDAADSETRNAALDECLRRYLTHCGAPLDEYGL
jgi:hypothetical protein